METRTLILNGLGRVGQAFLGLLEDRSEELASRYGLRLVLTGAVDSGGACFDPTGLDSRELLDAKRAGRSVASLPGGEAGQAATCLLEHHGADRLLEAAPTNFWNGEPGLSVVRAALQRGIPAILASKGPLVLAWDELAALSDLSDPARPALRFSAAVGGALPSVNLGRRDLAGARIRGFEAVLNLSCPLVMARVEQGMDYAEAVAGAQAAGLLEADPSLDLEGWDLAAKLVILARAALGVPLALPEVPRRGVASLQSQDFTQARNRGERLVMLARAAATESGWAFSVGPEALPAAHPLAAMPEGSAGILYDTDTQGRQACFTHGQNGPLGTAAAMLRDLLELR